MLATTWMPVGRWVTRIALATLLTFWPPGPLARTNATISMSFSGTTRPVSSNSGVTSTVAKLVWRLPSALNGLTRASRCVPRSQFM